MERPAARVSAPSVAASVGKGVAAGLAGTVVMTTFQRFVEMPLTGRAAHGLAGRRGLRGQRAVATVFGTVFTGDALLNTALGLYKPWRWSVQDWAIDIIDKLVLAEATGLIFDQIDAGR